MRNPVRALIAVFACGCAGAQGPAFHGSANQALATTSEQRSTDCNTPIDAVPEVGYRKKMARIAEVADDAGSLSPLDGGAGAVGGTAIMLGGAMWVGIEALAAHVATQDLRDERDRCRAHNQQAAEFQRSRTKALTVDARQLTQLAAEAARSGDCERARRLEGAVDDQDPAVHDEVFMRDPAIRWCLTGEGAVPTAMTALRSMRPPPTTAGSSMRRSPTPRALTRVRSTSR